MHCAAVAPAGASLCCSEDGRRLLLFGGHDGGRLLNDVYVLELEQQRYVWTVLHPSGARGWEAAEALCMRMRTCVWRMAWQHVGITA